MNNYEKENISWIFYGLGEYFKSKGLHSEAIDYYQKSWDIAKIYCSDLITSLLKLAELQQNKNSKQKSYQKALEFAANKFPNNHRIFAKIFNDSAEIDRDNGLYDQAIKKYQEALNIYKTHFNDERKIEDRYRIAFTLDNLAKVYERQKQFDQALSFHNESLEIVENFLKEKPDDDFFLEHKARCLFNLAEFHINNQSYTKRKDLEGLEIKNIYLKKGLGIFKNIWGEENPNFLEFLSIYIDLCRKINDREEVEQKLENFHKVLNILKCKNKKQYQYEINKYNDFFKRINSFLT